MNPTLYAIIVVVSALLIWLLRLWLKSTIEGAVKHGFAEELEVTKLELSKELELFKSQLKRHDQAILVAALLARRVGGPDHIQDTNRQIWEAQLWLPAAIALRLSTVLVEGENFDGVKSVLVDVRKLIHGPADPMTAGQFAHVQEL